MSSSGLPGKSETTREQAVETADFEVYVGDEFQAATYGPRDVALAEARHYAIQCAQDGPARIVEVVRIPVEVIELGTVIVV